MRNIYIPHIHVTNRSIRNTDKDPYELSEYLFEDTEFELVHQVWREHLVRVDTVFGKANRECVLENGQSLRKMFECELAYLGWRERVLSEHSLDGFASN